MTENCIISIWVKKTHTFSAGTDEVKLSCPTWRLWNAPPLLLMTGGWFTYIFSPSIWGYYLDSLNMKETDVVRARGRSKRSSTEQWVWKCVGEAPLTMTRRSGRSLGRVMSWGKSRNQADIPWREVCWEYLWGLVRRAWYAWELGEWMWGNMGCLGGVLGAWGGTIGNWAWCYHNCLW